MSEIYTLKSPKNPRSGVVFNSPHSGSHYQPEFLESSNLDSLAIRSSEDAFVNELFSDAPKHGAYLLSAHAPRAFIDLNRSATELDPAIVQGVKRQPTNPRIAAGLGIIPRVVADGQVIRTGKIPLAEAQSRIDNYYTPYHNCLRNLIDQQRDVHGMAVLIDCHSMPQSALVSAPLVRGKKPDIILGDRFGASCDRWIVESATQIFAAAGFVVARNAPFSGGYITQHYGRPSKGVHAFQIEINRALYMNERSVERADNFYEICATLSEVTRQLSQIGPAHVALAAE